MNTVAIVGCSFRGLVRIEFLMESLTAKRIIPDCKLLVIESETCPGAGQVLNWDQVDTNWLNISDRALQTLDGRPTLDGLPMVPKPLGKEVDRYFEPFRSAKRTCYSRDKGGTFWSGESNWSRFLRDVFSEITSEICQKHPDTTGDVTLSEIREIDSGLFIHLKEDDLLQPVTSEHGVSTQWDGTVNLLQGNEHIHLSMLGRNCIGSVIGVDAILECFGVRVQNCAKAIATRLVSNEKQ